MSFSIREVHEVLGSIVGESVGIAFGESTWGPFVESQVRDAASSLGFRDHPLPIEGIVARLARVDLTHLGARFIEDVRLPGDSRPNPVPGMSVGPVEFTIEVRVEGLTAPVEYFSQHTIRYEQIQGAFVVEDGRVMLRVDSGTRFVVTEVLEAPDAVRQGLRDELIARGVSPRLLDYFVERIEPSLGFAAGADAGPKVVESITFFELNKSFPSFRFDGGLQIVWAETTATRLIVLAPLAGFRIERDCDCAGSAYEKEIALASRTIQGRSSIIVGRRRRLPRASQIYPPGSVNEANVGGDVYLHIPEKATATMFDPDDVVKKKRPQLRSKDSWNIFGFEFSHHLYGWTSTIGSTSWSTDGPVVTLDFKLGFAIDLEVWLKIGCLKTHIVTAGALADETFNFEVLLTSFGGKKGVISFYGELIDPTNLELDWRIKTPLGDWFDRGVLWFLRNVVEPFLRILVAAFIAFFTWPVALSLIKTSPTAANARPMGLEVKDYFVSANRRDVTIALTAVPVDD